MGSAIVVEPVGAKSKASVPVVKVVVKTPEPAKQVVGQKEPGKEEPRQLGVLRKQWRRQWQRHLPRPRSLLWS